MQLVASIGLLAVMAIDNFEMARIPLITACILLTSLTYAQVADTTDVEELMITVFEKAPAPQGGLESYFKWINENNRLKYLSDTLTFNDKVFVEFIIDKDRRVTTVKKAKGIGEPYDQEAIRLIRENPTNWDPAEQRGKKFASTLILPVYFVDERLPKYEPEKKRKRKNH